MTTYKQANFLNDHSVTSTIAPHILFSSLFQFKWLINCDDVVSEWFIEIIITRKLRYLFAKIPWKAYSKFMELDMKSIDAADIKL